MTDLVAKMLADVQFVARLSSLPQPWRNQEIGRVAILADMDCAELCDLFDAEIAKYRVKALRQGGTK